MYARVVTVQFKQGMSGEGKRITEQSILPAVKQEKGFKNIYLLADDNTDKGIFVSLWESEADLKASESSGFFQEQMTKLGAVFAAPPSRDLLKVAVQG
jgi:heme-degrading monooxygenase HmoA